MTRYLLLLTATLAIAGGLIAFAVTAFGQTTRQYVEISAAEPHAHTDATNPLDAVGTAICGTNFTHVGWDRFVEWTPRGDEWNGLTFHVTRDGNRGPYEIWIVGSATRSPETKTFFASPSCRNSRGETRGRPRQEIEARVIGAVPSDRAPESLYHDHHHTDGPHPDSAARTDLTALAEEIGEAQCLELQNTRLLHTHWDASKTAPTQLPAIERQLIGVIASER